MLRGTYFIVLLFPFYYKLEVSFLTRPRRLNFNDLNDFVSSRIHYI